MDSCRHRGRSQFSENDSGRLVTTSKMSIIIPVKSRSATMMKMDTVVVHKIRRSSSLVHKRYRYSLESSHQSYPTVPLMSRKNVCEFEVDHLNIQHSSTPIENTCLGSLYDKELAIKRKEVRYILSQGTGINVLKTSDLRVFNSNYQFYV